jgi:hypothetical protein
MMLKKNYSIISISNEELQIVQKSILRETQIDNLFGYKLPSQGFKTPFLGTSCKLSVGQTRKILQRFDGYVMIFKNLDSIIGNANSNLCMS